jgi:hypothetical protein
MILSGKYLTSAAALAAMVAAMLACNLSGSAAPAEPAQQNAAQPIVATVHWTATAKAETAKPADSPTPTATTMPSPTVTLTFTKTPTATVQLLAGTISGTVWHDLNNNGKKNSGEGGFSGITVSLGQGACLSYGFLTDVTTGAGTYYFSGVTPGVYCVRVIPDTPGRIVTTSAMVTVMLGSGGNEIVNFGLF